MRGQLKALAVLVLLSAPGLTAAEERIWVGEQNEGACAPWTLETGSFFDGWNWSEFRFPEANDTAVFGSTFDPQQNGTFPHYIHFGDFCKDSKFCSDPYIPGQDWSIGDVYVDSDDWTFDLGSGRMGSYDCDIPTHQVLTFTIARLAIGKDPVVPASLTIRHGRLHNTFVAHVTRDPWPGAAATVVVHGTDARWDVDAYVDLGWVGHGKIIVDEGATMTAGAVYAGIRDGAVGELEIRRSGQVELRHLDVGFGHESSGDAQGILLVTDHGSRLTIEGGVLNIGGMSRGNASIRAGAEVHLVASSARITAPVGAAHRSVVTVSDPNSEWIISDDLTVGVNGDLTVRSEGWVAVGSRLEVAPGGTVAVGPLGVITVGQCPAQLRDVASVPRGEGVIVVCPGGTLVADGTIDARIMRM